MYRRNISHILASLGLLLVLFVLYHSWIKPTYLPATPTSRPPTLQAEKEPPVTAPPDTALQPILQDSPEEQRRQQRLIPAGEPPATSLADTLRGIHEDIDKHETARAQAQLLALPQEALKDPHVRQYAAGLWNNLGIQQERMSGTAAAVKAYQMAAALDAGNATVLLNLAHAYWEQRDPRLTQPFLTDLIAKAPHEPFPHLAMADLLQESDRLDEAAQHLEQAVAQAKKDPNVRSYLEAVTAKVKRTAAAEQKFSSQATTHFVVKYDGEEDQTTWMTVLDILEDAYREIGQKLGYFPSKPIYVVLHTKSSFQSATGSPAWADGLYDGILGRIQIPTQGALTDKAWLTRVLRHEFVHALLHQQMGTESGALPTWLNEGLAMQLAGDSWPDIDQVLRGIHAGEIKLIPLNQLEGGWGAFPGVLATVAYLEGNSATNYLIDRFGMNAVRDILGAIKRKRSLGGALQDHLFMPYDQFQRQWIETLNDKLTAPTG